MIMEKSRDVTGTICLIGEGKLADSIAVNLANANQKTIVLAPEAKWPDFIPCSVVIVLTEEQLITKKQIIQRLESRVALDTILAINTESISLGDLQAGSTSPSRIIGLNWSYPADLSFFLEIIVNDDTDPAHQATLEWMARHKWSKDPYTLRNGFSIRGRLVAAIAREAFYLVENGYATVESVDRSCRNDAGYYLSFAGNFRYMDLMGTGVYGVVMETLNRELATQKDVGPAIKQLVEEGKTGMEAQSGFYQYSFGDQQQWEEVQQLFGQDIKRLMESYPVTFDYDSNQ